MNPIVAVLRDSPVPVPNKDLNQATAKRMGLDTKVLAVLHDPEKSEQPESFYRMAWARTYLKRMGFIDNPTLGVWSITKKGREAEQIDPSDVVRKVQSGADADAVTAEVPEHVAEELLELYRKVASEGRVPIGDELDACYLRFRQKFGPDVLRSVDGEQMLETIHGRGGKESLVYWLEFKNDEEFPRVFGSIAGGSALKFGIYFNRKSGHWMTGHPSAQERLSVSQAVELVRKQRDQLIAGANVLGEYADDPESADYAAIQRRIVEAAPDLAETAWGHKYFSLLFPKLLDDYHAVKYQEYNLIRLHKLPGDGRYENARLFAGIARQLGIANSTLASVLNRRHGEPHNYWRVGTTVSDTDASEWPRMRDGGFAAIGWTAIGSLEGIERNKGGKAQVRGLVEKEFPNKASVVTRNATQIFHFATTIEQGDVVVAMRGKQVLGVGEVTGDYFYTDDDGPFGHRRPVKWKPTSEWGLPRSEGLRTTFTKLGRYPGNLIEVERRLSLPDDPPLVPLFPGSGPKPKPELRPLRGLLSRIEAALRRKSQVILYGPPGTGKTYWAEQLVYELASRSWFRRSYKDLSDAERKSLVEQGAVEQCCFHPAYGYEDFLVGYRPVVLDGNMAFKSQKGIFAKLCERASRDPKHHYYLLIDEINRGDIPRIFGELIMVLEKDKRGKPITLPMMDEPLVVPPNVFVVGTMNTADRSIALLDAALRRRFAFIELMPDSTTLKGTSVGGLPLGPWLDELNQRVVRFAGRGSRNLQIGHSYLLSSGEGIQDKGRFAEVLRDDIIPLLQEYCYEDFDALAQILGETLVRRDQQVIEDSLFDPARRGELIEALLSEFQGITATPAAVDADAEVADDDDLDEDPQEDEADS
jgi:5-methylcytosine-specific restriction protein B